MGIQIHPLIEDSDYEDPFVVKPVKHVCEPTLSRLKPGRRRPTSGASCGRSRSCPIRWRSWAM
jgi:hypothetical protein